MITFAGLYFTKDIKSSEQSCDFEDIGILDAQTFDWATNQYNTSEMFFDYWLYNYGDSEAKNIVIRCDLWDEDGVKILATVRDNYGNLASRTADFGEVTTKDISGYGIYYIPLCYVESCDNCEVLYKRIPELVTSYEGL